MCERREHVLDYLYDECAPGDRRGVEAHLAECDSCRDELRGWRSVRTDLLAWDVPQQPSVWTPFAPPRMAPWYRQVPVWAMATAAMLVLAIGGAGGFVAHAASTSLYADVSAARGVHPVVATPALTEQQIREIVRAEAQAVAVNVVQPVASHQVDEAALMRQMSKMVSDSEARVMQKQGEQLVTYYQESAAQRTRDLSNIQTVLDGRLKQASGVIAGDVWRNIRALQAGQPDSNKKER